VLAVTQEPAGSHQLGAAGMEEPIALGALVVDRTAITPRPDILYHTVLFALCSSVLLFAAILSIRDGSQVMLPMLGAPLPELCTMRRLTGMNCPGCGMTRSFIALAHGDVAAAWSYNPAGLFWFAVVAFQIPFRGYQVWRIRRGLAEIELGRTAIATFILLGALLLGQWVLRIAGVSI
jgi:hypothetical protein